MVKKSKFVGFIENKESFLWQAGNKVIANQRKDTVFWLNDGNHLSVVDRKSDKSHQMAAFLNKPADGVIKLAYRIVSKHMNCSGAFLDTQSDKIQ